MLPVDGKNRWMCVVEIAVLLSGICLRNSVCESTDLQTCRQNKVLFVSSIQPNTDLRFPSKAICRDDGGNKLCFIWRGTAWAGCCHTGCFDYNTVHHHDLSSYLIVYTNTLFRPDALQGHLCKPSAIYNKNSGFLMNIHRCLNGTDSIRWSQIDFCRELSPHDHCCQGLAGGKFCITVFSNDTQRMFCKPSVSGGKDDLIHTTMASEETSTVTEATTTSEETSTVTEATTTSEETSTVTEATTTSVETSTVAEATTVKLGEETPRPTDFFPSVAQMVVSSLAVLTVQPLSIELSNNGTSLENAANIMNNISFLLERIGSSTTANIKIGNARGVITKLPEKYLSNINVAKLQKSGNVTIVQDSSDVAGVVSELVHIPKEASEIAQKQNSSFAGVFLFPGIHQDDPTSSFLNDEVTGIEMGVEISNLSDTIDIQYKNVDKNGRIASCRSWDGRGKKAIWVADGCRTNETGDSITCHCNHLTFFAVLLSPPPQNISSTDFTALTYITSIGCGLSLFFLTVALGMHCLIRKGKASQATKILINLFVAMLTLNLSFLVNESIAKLGNFGACVTMAAVMHYSMLATFTWFFMEALHLLFYLWKITTKTTHYMKKICIAGWVTPATVVIAFLAAGKYDYMDISTDGGNSAKMCWISDAVVHQGVNVGYYAIVFIFTFTAFIITVRHIVLLKPTAGKDQDNSSIKTNAFSVIGLLLLLGITWAFAFFSYGPLVIASYYIFTILNSFQGFFLFIYYYKTRNFIGEDQSDMVSSISTTISKTSYVVSPYK